MNVVLIVAPKPKASKFGFLASAKKLVASVWGRGKAAAPATPAASTPPIGGVAKTTNTMTSKSSSMKKKSTPGFMPTKPSSTTGTTSSMGSGTANSRLSVTSHGQEQKASIASSSSRARSPIPSTFSKPGTAGSSRASSVRLNSVGGSKISARGSTTSNAAGVSSIGMRLSTASNAGASAGGVGSMGMKGQSRTSSITSSRLLAPTASSLAKTRKLDTTAGPSASGSTTSTPTPAGAVGNVTNHSGLQKKKPSLLSAITNSPNVQRKRILSPPSSRIGVRSPSGLPLWSPRSSSTTTATPGKIFSKPVTANGPSGIPVLASSLKKSEDGDIMMGDAETKPPTTVARQRTMTRKPRISRSKVIARLASQRAAASSSSSSRIASNPGVVPATPVSRPSGLKPPASAGGRRTRSSFGARRGRTSFVGPGILTPGSGRGGIGKGDRERSVLASAKKRVRQSEVARRRSRVSGGMLGRNE